MVRSRSRVKVIHKGHRIFASASRQTLLSMHKKFDGDIIVSFWDTVWQRITIWRNNKSYYKSSSVCLFVCLSVCLFVPYLLRGPLTDLRQTWWVYVGGPRNCPWGVLFRKGQRLDGSTGHFHFPLYYICASLTPHSCKRRLCCYCN